MRTPASLFPSSPPTLAVDCYDSAHPASPQLLTLLVASLAHRWVYI